MSELTLTVSSSFEEYDISITGNCNDGIDLALTLDDEFDIPFGVAGGEYQSETDPVFAASEAYNFETGDKAKLDDVASFQSDTQDPTGFIDNSNIVIAYDSTARTITLTHSSGSIVYYWQGERKTLDSPWVSDAHDNDSDPKYLMSTDGENFVWSDNVWAFNYLQVAYVPGGRQFAARETHGTTDWKLHQRLHKQDGTILYSGGGLVAGTFQRQPAVPANADNTPSFAACVIEDEDLQTSLLLWPENTYTTCYFSSSGTANFSTVATSLLRVSGTYPNYNPYNGSTFSETEASGNKYLNYYVCRIPVTADTNSQKYRAVVIQPQFQYGTLAAALAESTLVLYLGELSTIASEMVLVEKITFHTSASYGTTGKARIEEHSILTGARFQQIAVSGITPTTAENVSFSPAGNIASTNVQDGMEELDTEKVASDEINIIKKLSQAEYDVLGAYSDTTLYVIVG